MHPVFDFSPIEIPWRQESHPAYKNPAPYHAVN